MILLIASFILLWVYAIGRSEIVECLNWNNQASAYSGFYLTEWQYNQCESHNIFIDARVVADENLKYFQ